LRLDPHNLTYFRNYRFQIFTARRYFSAVYAVIVFFRPSVRPSVTSRYYCQNVYTWDRANNAT